MNLQKLFSDKEFNRKLLALVIPVVFQNLMASLVAAADTFMLCRHSQYAMAAVALASQIQFIQALTSGAFLGGLGLMGAQYWGKRDIPVMEKLLAMGVRINLYLTVVSFIGCFFVPEYLMKLYASDPELIRMGAEYLRIVSFSFFFYNIARCYIFIMRTSGHVSCTVVVNIMTVLLNVIFNAVFIFGLFGAPALGIKGAALATCLSGFIEWLVVVLLSYRRDFISLYFKRLFSFDKVLILDYCRFTLPVMGSSLLWGVGFSTYTAVIGHLGKDAAAANAIAAVTRNICCCVCDGLALGTSILVGHELGAGNLRQGKLYGHRAFIFAFLLGGCTAVLILAALPVVSSMISLTGDAQYYLKGMFFVLAVYIIGRSVSSVAINGIFNAGGDTLFNVYSLVVVMWCFSIPCALLGAFYFHWPVVVVFACTCLDEISKLPWVVWHFRKYKWVRNITR